MTKAAPNHADHDVNFMIGAVRRGLRGSQGEVEGQTKRRNTTLEE